VIEAMASKPALQRQQPRPWQACAESQLRPTKSEAPTSEAAPGALHTSVLQKFTAELPAVLDTIVTERPHETAAPLPPLPPNLRLY
jgi:hypothetical protein